MLSTRYLRTRPLRLLTTIAVGIILVFPTAQSGAGGSGESTAPTARDSASKPIVAATDATWPPMEYIDENGQIVGFDIDLFNEIAERAGFSVRYQNTAWDGIFAGIGTGAYDVIVSSVTLLEERKKRMLFSYPYMTAAQYLVVRTETSGVTGIGDLRGREVGAEIGTTGSRFVREQPGVTVRTYDDLGLGVEDLLNGRIAGIVADTAIVEYFVLRNPRVQGQLKVVGDPYAIEDYAFPVRKDLPELRDTINDALLEILRDGTWWELYKRWYPASSQGYDDQRESPAFPGLSGE